MGVTIWAIVGAGVSTWRSRILQTIIGIAFLARTLTLVLVAALSVRVSTTTGESVDGELQGIGDSSVLVTIDGQQQEFKFENLATVVPLDRDDSATGPPMRVTLLSGSKIAAQDLSLADEVLSIEPRRQRAVTVPLREVKSIRFRAASPATDPQWLGLLENKDRRDQLAIRRQGNQIDPAPVLIESIADGNVGFSIEGETAAAPIGRLEGVVLGGNRQVVEDAEIQIVDIYGSKWLAKAIEPGDGETLKLKLSESITHQLPTKHLYSMSWTAGLVMLAAQEPARSTYQPYVETRLATESLAKWFGPKPEGQTDLTMVGGALIEYRVAGDFATLAGSVRRDERVAKAGYVAVQISLDDREVWKEELVGSDAKGFEIALDKARRLRIEVLSGDDGDVGDTVRIVRPRLLK